MEEEHRTDPLIAWLTGRPGVIAAVTLMALSLVVQLLPHPSPGLVKAAAISGLGVALLAFLIVGDLYLRIKRDQESVRRIRQEVKLLRAGVEHRIGVRFLPSAERVFETLCDLREESTTIRLMMMRDEPPVRFNQGGEPERDADGRARYVKESPHFVQWYEGLPIWLAGDPERMLERLTCDSTPGMVAYQRLVQGQMQAARASASRSGAGHGEWSSLVLEMGGLKMSDLPPFLNLCIFDDAAAFISFSGRPGRRQHPNLKGLLLRDQAVVRFFAEEYFEPFKEFVLTHHRMPSPPQRAETQRASP